MFNCAITGPVELKVTFDDHEPNRTHFSVDLDSVYKTPSGDLVYWLEKAEVEERNKWELIVTVEFIDGTEGHFTSRPFQIRTKSGKSGKVPDEGWAGKHKLFHSLNLFASVSIPTCSNVCIVCFR